MQHFVFPAGYRMMSVTDPALCRRVALRHCLALIGLSTLFPVCDVTTWWLAADSLPLNLWFTWLGWRFYTNSDTKSARELFRFSLLHLPLLMILVMLHKKPKRENEDLPEIAAWTKWNSDLIKASWWSVIALNVEFQQDIVDTCIDI